MKEGEKEVASVLGAEKKEEGSAPVAPKTRQIIIETDGNSINIVKAEVGGTIELVGILRNLIEHFTKTK